MSHPAPSPPQDINLMNIIDKLAQFVARNGTEFEQMTKIKQNNNSKFSFLKQNDEFFDYYQFKLMESRRSLLSKYKCMNDIKDILLFII
jgi:calcium homeostasis endoplasmic reticulum protein